LRFGFSTLFFLERVHMKLFIKALLASFCLVCMLGGVSAHTRESASDSEAIAAVMKGIWDTPGNALAVEPIVLSGDDGLAGWTQSERGGRALLHKVKRALFTPTSKTN
jgi:hypothetical protein